MFTTGIILVYLLVPLKTWTNFQYINTFFQYFLVYLDPALQRFPWNHCCLSVSSSVSSVFFLRNSSLVYSHFLHEVRLFWAKIWYFVFFSWKIWHFIFVKVVWNEKSCDYWHSILNLMFDKIFVLELWLKINWCMKLIF